LANFKDHALGRQQDIAVVGQLERVIEREEKELLEEEELDKLFLKNICGKIMDEVMDSGRDYDVILPRSHPKKRGTKKGKNQIDLRSN
jgi:hypothetical protein